MKKNKLKVMQKALWITCCVLFLLFPLSSRSSNNNTMNFLPMEDALSTTRNVSEYSYSKVKPYKEPLPLKKEKSDSNIFENVDFLAFLLLGIVFFLVVNRKSKPRNISL